MAHSISTLKVLLVEPEPGQGEALAKLLRYHGYDSVMSTNAQQAIDRFLGDPDIGLVICSLELPDSDGITLVQQIKARTRMRRSFEAILLTVDDSRQPLVRALREGFADYLHKPLDEDLVLQGVRRAEIMNSEREGESLQLSLLNDKIQFLAESVENLYQDLERLRAGTPNEDAALETTGARGPITDVFSSLSPRQLDVARLVGKGQTNHQIADALGITENTVKLYVSQVLRLTHMHNRTQLALALTPQRDPGNSGVMTH